MARDEDKAQFEKLLENKPENKNFYELILKKQIETISLIRDATELCNKAEEWFFEVKYVFE